VIFISTDDNEVSNLRQIMNEIFGEENFVACISWQKKVSPANDAKWFSGDHDYILVYARSKQVWRPNRLKRTKEQEQ
jgi:adenine-specific DNA-methyltransferase